MVIRFTGRRAEVPFPRKLQFRFFVTFFFMLFSLPFRLRRNLSKEVLYYNNIDNPEIVNMRRYFLHKHLQNPGGKAAILGFDSYRIFPKFYFNRLSSAKLWAIYKVAVTFTLAAFLDLFRPTRIHWMWRLTLVNKTLQQILWHTPCHPQYQFFSYEPSTYLSALIASHYLNGYQPNTISSNSVQVFFNRYLWNPRLNYKLCSRFQIEETQCYIDLGWMELGSREIWGLEEEVYLDAVLPTAPTYDIGIYTGGFWARTKTHWRSGDLDALRKYKYIDNPVYAQFIPILEAIVALKNEHDLKVKVYLHPYENSLIREYGIKPPALGYMEENGIVWDVEGKTSLDNFYEPKVGVAMLSTIVFDRLHYGLPSYFFKGKGVPNYNLRYLSWCKDYVYYGPDDLKNKLKKELGL